MACALVGSRKLLKKATGRKQSSGRRLNVRGSAWEQGPLFVNVKLQNFRENKPSFFSAKRRKIDGLRYPWIRTGKNNRRDQLNSAYLSNNPSCRRSLNIFSSADTIARIRSRISYFWYGERYRAKTNGISRKRLFRSATKKMRDKKIERK